MEWCIRIQNTPDAEFLQASEAQANGVIHHRPPGLFRVNQMLRNGGRYYVDVGDHLEYATPEDATFMGTVTNEIAGEHNVYSSLAAAKKAGNFHDFKLNKRVVDDETNTWGYHVSFCCSAEKMQINKKHLGVIGLHLATQNVYAGAGAVHRKKNGTVRFTLAQKVLNLNVDYADSSHRHSQPLVSTRDEPLAHESDWIRVHLTSMDANMSPWASWMRLGTTSLVLRLVEAGYYGEDLMPQMPMSRLAQQVAADLTLQRMVTLTDGRTIRPLDMQTELFSRAQKLSKEINLPKEEQEALGEWEDALTDLKTDPLLLIDRADWVAKKAALERYIGKHELNWAAPEVAAKDRQWDDIGPNGIGQRMRKTIWREWMPTYTDIEHARFHAPEHTRAKLRGQAVREIARTGLREASVTWENITWAPGNTIELNNPYQIEFPKPTAVIEQT